MEENPAAVSGKLTPYFTKEHKDALWVNLVEELNGMGGGIKSLFKWRKTWIDFKQVTQQKMKEIQKQCLDSTSQKSVRTLGILEERVAALLEKEAEESSSQNIDWTTVASQLEGIVRAKEDLPQSTAVVPDNSVSIPVIHSLQGPSGIDPIVKLEPGIEAPLEVAKIRIETIHGGIIDIIDKEVPSLKSDKLHQKVYLLEKSSEESSTVEQLTKDSEAEYQQIQNEARSCSVEINANVSLSPIPSNSEVQNKSGNFNADIGYHNKEADIRKQNAAFASKVLNRKKQSRACTQDLAMVQSETNEILKSQTEAFREMTHAFNRIADAIYSLSANRN